MGVQQLPNVGVPQLPGDINRTKLPEYGTYAEPTPLIEECEEGDLSKTDVDNKVKGKDVGEFCLRKPTKSKNLKINTSLATQTHTLVVKTSQGLEHIEIFKNKNKEGKYFVLIKEDKSGIRRPDKLFNSVKDLLDHYKDQKQIPYLKNEFNFTTPAKIKTNQNTLYPLPVKTPAKENMYPNHSVTYQDRIKFPNLPSKNLKYLHYEGYSPIYIPPLGPDAF